MRPRALSTSWTSTSSTSPRLMHVLDVVDTPGPDVRDVQEAVGALLELDERAEVGRLHDLAGELVADFRRPW